MQKDRLAVAAGRFYSNNATELTNHLKKLENKAKSISSFSAPSNADILGLICPHAGYVFSGTVAAAAFTLLSSIKPRKKVFILGSSHNMHFSGASVYNIGNYQTPLGSVKVDIALANKLIQSSEYINYITEAHTREHSIEVQLPFLQHYWGKDFDIIPIVLGSKNEDCFSEIADILAPYLNNKNLFVVSTDFSHYPSYAEAQTIDSLTTKAIISGKPENLIRQLRINEQKGIDKLSTSLCGWTSVLTTLYATEKLNTVKYLPILYQNSGDYPEYASKDKVVGYQSIAITRTTTETTEFELNQHDKSALINTARSAIEQHFSTNKPKPDFSEINEKLKSPGGAFVSIYYENQLRGCIGRMQSTSTPLIEIIHEVAHSAAFYDSRFKPITKNELPEIKIEISVLTPMHKIISIDEIILGKHGVYIKKGVNTGTFLPQVADKTNWNIEEFLGHCARDKANIGWNGWKDAEIYTYEAIIISE